MDEMMLRNRISELEKENDRLRKDKDFYYEKASSFAMMYENCRKERDFYYEKPAAVLKLIPGGKQNVTEAQEGT